MQIFGQDSCPSREILLTTVYHHRNSRTSSSDAPEFSFLVESLPSKPDQDEQDVDQQILKLKELNESILERMYLLNEKIKEELTKRGRMEYLKITDKPFPSANESVQYKRSLGNPTEFSEVEREASVFEVDENNNFFKYKQKSASKHQVSMTHSLILNQTKKREKSKPKPFFNPSNPNTHSKRKRVYQSVLSCFSTARLLKMNAQQ